MPGILEVAPQLVGDGVLVASGGGPLLDTHLTSVG